MCETSVLIEKYLQGELTKAERQKLMEWVLAKEENRVFFKNRIREYDRNCSTDFDHEAAFLKFSGAITTKKSKKRIPFHIFRYAAVFAILLASAIFVKSHFLDNPQPTDNRVTKEQPIFPDKEGIVLKLDDGSTQEIDSESDGLVQDAQGNVIANKDKNQLTFDSKAETEKTRVRFNELYVPNGQRFKVKLSDGTWVWLNSGSKLRFPQHFARGSKSREVFLEGEAFFDVTKNAQKPFIVTAENINIKVLGTRFNLSAYGTDDAIATTLVEGAVNVYEIKTPKNRTRLSPSYQANFNKSTKSLGKQKVNTSLYTAWMQNKLIINDLTFPEILKKLERTHNVTFINKAPHLNAAVFQGEFHNESVESILKTIALSTPFSYKIEQNRITILK
ncbi:FecR family protein [Pricia antarctica]|uniref:FecR family protein n=1 Tax=Pricia antarctica TaxID=641691 RepID=A0A1G7EKZ5_9FLAO|nr:FecR domain-containing protein [Pricia antarctica]SDE64257.1 FecR family protein [Pricia antarctica]